MQNQKKKKNNQVDHLCFHVCFSFAKNMQLSIGDAKLIKRLIKLVTKKNKFNNI